MEIYGNPVMISGASKLNIDYGQTAPTNTSKLWVPLFKKPSKVGITSYLAGQVGGMAVEKPNLVTLSKNLSSVKIGNKLWGTSGSLYGGTQYANSKGYLIVYNPETQQLEKNIELDNVAYVARGLCLIGNNVYCSKSYYSEYDSSSGRRYSHLYNTLCMVNQETGARIETNFNINEINRSAYGSAVTDGTKLYLIGGTTSEDYYVNKIWVVDVSDYSYNSYTIPSLYRASRAIYYNNALYIVYNNTDYAVNMNTKIGKFDLTTFTFSVIYENNTDMIGNYGWSFTNDGSSAFMAYPSRVSSPASSSVDYTNSTLLVDLSSKTITTKVVNNQKPSNITGGDVSQSAIGNKIYMFGYGDSYNNNLYYIPYERLLPENELSILATIDSTGMNIVDDKRFSIKISPIIVYIGNSNNKAQKTNAYLYDGTKWKDITT